MLHLYASAAAFNLQQPPKLVLSTENSLCLQGTRLAGLYYHHRVLSAIAKEDTGKDNDENVPLKSMHDNESHHE